MKKESSIAVETVDYGVTLTPEQELFISTVMNGHNTLVNACVGSGKTTAIQHLCEALPSYKSILYLTYNRLLKLDAQTKIRAKNVTVNNYHGFAYQILRRDEITVGVSDQIQEFLKLKPILNIYDVLVIDEYQDIDQEISDMLLHIQSSNPSMQVVVVGDMEQKIYDKTTLYVPTFIDDFLGDHKKLEFTRCFRLPAEHASMLGRIWNKNIVGVNRDCIVESMQFNDVVKFLSTQDPSDILCLGERQGSIAECLNNLERNYPEVFNKRTVYASISENDKGTAQPKQNSAIFTTFDSSKGLERKICVVFDFTESYWGLRSSNTLQKYDILRNIFCVAASRGKERIIFVNNNEQSLSERSLATPFDYNIRFGKEGISKMFDFKYKEDIEACFSLLDIHELSTLKDTSEIDIPNTDELIDLSPCIGIYQEAVFFNEYNVDKDIELALLLDKNKSYDPSDYTNLSLDEKILLLTSIDTHQDRYRSQVDIPFVTDNQKQLIIKRLSLVFTGEETTQYECHIDFFDKYSKKLYFSTSGLADVVIDNVVYELKFVSELTHEHFLQCACYMVASGLEKGILWNTRNNMMYEIRVPNTGIFLDAVTKTITKGVLQSYCGPLKRKIGMISSPQEPVRLPQKAQQTSSMTALEIKYLEILAENERYEIEKIKEQQNQKEKPKCSILQSLIQKLTGKIK